MESVPLNQLSRLQEPPVEHGGVSHLSSRPQHVFPGLLLTEFNMKAAGDMIFSISRLPHLPQRIVTSSLPTTKNSSMFPHSLHRYS